jgi:hypothetical protein
MIPACDRFIFYPPSFPSLPSFCSFLPEDLRAEKKDFCGSQPVGYALNPVLLVGGGNLFFIAIYIMELIETFT